MRGEEDEIGKKHKGVTVYCKLMSDADVGASYFGRNSLRVCPKRKYDRTVNIVEAGNCVYCGRHIDDGHVFLCKECRRKDEGMSNG